MSKPARRGYTKISSKKKLIPDTTTAGDFTRRFGRDDIVKRMESVNTVRDFLAI